MKIPTQLSKNDRIFLEGIMDTISKNKTYSYLEIGSYLGGSIYKHLLNEKCVNALSVDLRPEKQNDERGTEFTYDISTDSMMDVLKVNNIPTDKLVCFNDDISKLETCERFDLAFIDGEHTNRAAFSDSLNVLPLMLENSIIIYHDTSMVYAAIECFETLLSYQKISFISYKLKDSEIHVIILGKMPNVETYCLDNKEDFETFKIKAKIFLSKETKKYNESTSS